MTEIAILKKKLNLAIDALEEIQSRRSFGPGVAEITLEKIAALGGGGKKSKAKDMGNE